MHLGLTNKYCHQEVTFGPHVHGPGTVLNNQFKGSGVFENYSIALEIILLR